MIRDRFSRALLLTLLLAPLSAAAQSSFEEGTAAFRSGEYSRALEAFLEARREGNSSPTLTYNTGLTYLKLGRYEQAAETFARLLIDSEWRELARFNLALVAEKRGEIASARAAYQQLAVESQSEKLRRVVDARLARLSPQQLDESPPAPIDRFDAILHLATGNDDNAFSLQDDIQLNSSDAEDSFNEYFAWAQYYLRGSAADGWRAHGFLYSRQYQEFESLDIDARSVGLSRHKQYETWHSEVGLANIATDLDGDELTTQNKLLLRLQRPVGNSWFNLAYTPSNHSGGEFFEHLDGWQHVVEAKWRFPGEALSFDLGYRFESNNRDDLLTDNEFFSYSPTRHSVGVGIDWRVSSSWELSLAADFRSSTYDGINRLIDTDGVEKQAQREADQTKLQLKAQWSITPNLRFSGWIESTDNEENFETYSYDKTETSFSLEYLL
ncbi:tetratricopeptide repeat protein [Proteobacteria bacterium 005FR1]|nr:tetratricopeptide repeat protein [Proteobacteria bacterium 005FR1]